MKQSHGTGTSQALAFLLSTALLGCGGAAGSSRIVEEPAGEVVSYGAPRNVTYVTEMDAMQDVARLTVYRTAQCDVLPVTLMQRYEEKVHGKRVVERTAMSRRQVVGKAKGQVVCDQTYARDVQVMFEVDGGRFTLGKTGADGSVEGSLSELFKAGSFERVPENATLVVRPPQGARSISIGTVSFEQLRRQQERVTELLSKLEAILAQGESGASADDITRSYEIYAQLHELAPANPRVTGMSARFWELLFGRRLNDARDRMANNLSALSEAKETLKVMGDAAIPIYVQAAVNSGTMDQRALEWSSLRLINALRRVPAICSAGYSWSNLGSYGWPADARVAAHYTHFAYGSPYAAQVNHACQAF